MLLVTVVFALVGEHRRLRDGLIALPVPALRHAGEFKLLLHGTILSSDRPATGAFRSVSCCVSGDGVSPSYASVSVSSNHLLVNVPLHSILPRFTNSKLGYPQQYGEWFSGGVKQMVQRFISKQSNLLATLNTYLLAVMLPQHTNCFHLFS